MANRRRKKGKTLSGLSTKQRRARARRKKKTSDAKTERILDEMSRVGLGSPPATHGRMALYCAREANAYAKEAENLALRQGCLTSMQHVALSYKMAGCAATEAKHAKSDAAKNAAKNAQTAASDAFQAFKRDCNALPK